MKDEKKPILFVCYGLGIGGIEKCLINLLNVIPETYDIDVLLMNPYFTLKKQLKRNVNFLNLFDYVMNIEDTLSEIKRRGGILKNTGMFISYCMFRLRIKLKKNAWKGFVKVPRQYDVAIAYSQHDFSPYYVIDKVNAKKKCLWYHNGAYERQGTKYERDKKYYALFDKIVAVSTDCAKVLEQKFDFREGQLVVLRNICDPADILSKASEKKINSFEKGFCHIVSVGRMTPEKGVVLAIDACKQIHDQGYKIHWHWIGAGNQSEIAREEIKKREIEHIFILEGNQENPYPYINAADIYVQPSFYEAYSTTITEAKILKKPIVTTDVGGMRDQLIHGINGVIVPINAKNIATEIMRLIDDDDLKNRLSYELEKEQYQQIDIFRKYEELIFCDL